MKKTFFLSLIVLAMNQASALTCRGGVEDPWLSFERVNFAADGKVALEKIYYRVAPTWGDTFPRVEGVKLADGRTSFRISTIGMEDKSYFLVPTAQLGAPAFDAQISRALAAPAKIYEVHCSQAP